MSLGRVETNFGLRRDAKQIVDRLRKRLNSKVKATKRALVEFGLTVQGDSQALSPVDTGNLKASAYTIFPGSGVPAVKFVPYPNDKLGKKLAKIIAMREKILSANMRVIALRAGMEREFTVEVGHTVFYAMWQHDIPYRHNVGQWKFLETAIKKNVPRLLKFLAQKGRKA